MRASGFTAPNEHEVRALIGPTNTGKTHAAVERMLQHRSGLIGLPLRLLAREVYDRITARVGESAVALVTGEEKRVPARPRHWVCTVEAMPDPSERGEVDFLAVDEIQLCAHRERGHVFTDRVLHARGREETWFLGASTVRPLIERLVPGAIVESRPRLSTLRSAGALSLSALPPRTAVVTFSANGVYDLGERLRRKRGGAAIVLGALSPRTRNAQVALYQSGEVDYMVATDAIGMGLNLDLECVAFADVTKFDGRKVRALEDAELAQIAGRAGRYTRDGRFATLDPLPPLSAATVRAIEQHHFPPLDRAYFRESDVDDSSIEALRASLRRRPPLPQLELIDDADDTRALERLAQEPDVLALAQGPARVRLLWQVCQIPDFRQLALDDHFQLLRAIYEQLTAPRGRLDPDWIRPRVDRLDNASGDLDTLLARLAFIRTWTFISHRTRWLDDALTWQARTRAIEDRLSDAIHDRLVARFVDTQARRKRAPRAKPDDAANRTLADQLRSKGLLPAESTPAPTSATADDSWVEALVDAPHDEFNCDEDGRLFHGGRTLGRMNAGADLLHPEVIITASVGAGARLRLHRRLVAWTRDLVASTMAPLPQSDSLSPAARGLQYQLTQSLGTVTTATAHMQLATLSPADKSALRKLGVRLGRHVVYVPALLEPEAMRVRHALCAAALWRHTRVPPLSPSAPSFPAQDDVPDDIYASLGFPRFGPRALRADIAEEVGEALLRGRMQDGLAARAGCTVEDLWDLRDAFTHPAQTRRGHTA